LNEEMHELDDALREGDDAATCGELGDVLLQVLFHAVIAEERGAFGPEHVAGSLVGKMRRRHPWLYGTDTERTPWEQMKAKSRRSLADGLPTGLPALHRAHRLQERAAGVGFDWPDVEGPLEKVVEELAEVREAIDAPASATRSEDAPPHDVRSTSAGGPFGTYGVPSGDKRHAKLEEELGDLLFAVVNLCRKAGTHPSLALDRANAKFQRRFESIEALASERGIDVRTAGLEVLDSLWDEVKGTES
ncbi:MAG TPA: MazG nucleotide pyrophosphohydrolase domain-containing protein, partial [Gemmatimonadaceae bacterium]|nr:MazG nucleotide pyrophosphohydrolase domain-containing protein [Gemmatimonadaceae bacterium]